MSCGKIKLVLLLLYCNLSPAVLKLKVQPNFLSALFPPYVMYSKARCDINYHILG